MLIYKYKVNNKLLGFSGYTKWKSNKNKLKKKFYFNYPSVELQRTLVMKELFYKTYEDSVIAVAYNTSDEEIKISIAETEVAGMGIRGYLTLQGEVITLQDGILSMPAQSICILK